MPSTAEDAIAALVQLRGRRVRCRVGRNGWITSDETYDAEIEGNLRFVRPDQDKERGMHPTLCLARCCYRQPNDPPDTFGPKMTGVMEYRVMPADAESVQLAPSLT